MRLILTLVLSTIIFNSFGQLKPTTGIERLKVSEQRKQLAAASTINHIGFRNIGPSVMSGRVVDIEVNPTDPTNFYVAYATGGLWVTKNNGQSFTPIFDSADVIGIGDIAVNWQKNIIWLGTGEVNSSRSSYAGIGLYKSYNEGKSWEYIGLPESHHIGKIQLHPTNDATAWVAVLGHLYSANKERGVFKTTDGGKNWSHTLAIDENTGVVDIDINSKNPLELYAAAWYRTRRAWNFEESGATSGIYKSTDGGNTWKIVTTTNAGFPTGKGVGRIGLAVVPQNPTHIYAVVDNNFHVSDTAIKKDTSKYVLKTFANLTKADFALLNNGKLDSFLKKSSIPKKYTAENLKTLVTTDKLAPTAIWDYLYDANTALFETPIIGCEVYKSEDAGLTWVKKNKKQLYLYNTYGYYFGKIYVSEANEQKVIITGYDAELSTNGGETFKRIDKGNVHADHHAMWINPTRDSHMINGNDGGINITYDDGANWFKANTPAVGQFYAITVDMAKPYNVYGGLQDNGTWYAPSNTKEQTNWHASGHNPYKSINGGDGMQVQVDWRDNATVYSGYQFGFYTRSNLKSGSFDDDEKATPSEQNTLEKLEDKVADKATDLLPLFIRPKPDLVEDQYRFNWQTPILLSRHNQDILYYGSNKLHRSLEKGNGLKTLTTDLTKGKKEGNIPYGTLTTISESPLQFGLLYTGSDDGVVSVSKDGGTTFTNITPKLPMGLYVSRVTASAHVLGRVYASFNGYRNDHFNAYLLVSEDYGATWKNISGNLPTEPINVMKEDLKKEQILYIGTDGGLYVSNNAGNSYMAWNKGLPRSIPIHDIVIHERDNEIILGTHGRSLFIASLFDVQKSIK